MADTNQGRQELNVNLELVGVLLILYVIYVVGDIFTTRWLVLNDPYGIAHEANPIGRLLYTAHGVLGLTVAKVGVFIALTLVVLFTEAKYRDIWWFRELTETTLLGLLSFSTITLMNNSYAIIMINMQVGSSDILALYPVFKGFALLFSILLNTMILRARGYGSMLRYAELVVGTIIVAGPLLFFQPLIEFLSERLWLLLWYTLSIAVILGTAAYIIEEIRNKDKDPRRSIF